MNRCRTFVGERKENPLIFKTAPRGKRGAYDPGLGFAPDLVHIPDRRQ